MSFDTAAGSPTWDELVATLPDWAVDADSPAGSIHALLLVNVAALRQYGSAWSVRVADEVVAGVGARLLESAGRRDRLGRVWLVGGGEFAVGLADTGARAIVRDVEEGPVATSAGPLPVTVSSVLVRPRPFDRTLREVVDWAKANRTRFNEVG